MTPTETAAILRQFNDWRRDFDDKVEQPDSYEIGEAIDAAIEMIERLEAAEQECDALRAKIEAMERQEPVCWTTQLALELGSSALGFDACRGNLWGEKGVPLYARPGAQPAPFDDSATIAGLESAVTHLSVLLDSFRALLVEVNDVCGRDGHGGQLEDGESEIIDKVRAAISMTEAPPCAKGEEK